MAEGFEPYHVPQQSRRDKLRINSHHPPPQTGCAAETFQACASSLLPLYDPSLIPSDFNTCPTDVHRHAYGFLRGDTSVPCVKEEGANLMAFLGGAAASTHVFADPVLSTQLNPSSIHDVNGVPYAAFPSPAHCFPSYHYHHQDPNCTGQSLSLSLSSNHNPNLPLELNLQKYDFRHSTTGFGHVEFSKSAVPLGPFTGYASVLKGSRLLRPAQQLLEELCDMGRDVYSDKNWVDSELLDSPSLDTFSGDAIVQENGDGGDHQTRKKSRLLIMLDEVCKRYKQYYQQLHAAVSAFESVAGLNRAAPFANLALKAMSKHFRCLKNTITDQLQSASKCHADEAHQRPANPGSGTHGPRPFRGAGFMDPPVWRPQRGLPEHAVTVLRSWLFEHFLHPYPTDTDKLMLAKQTGLSRNQVSNWFINARVRLWKPMVEEVHMLETRQQGRQSSEQSPNDPPATRPAPPEPKNPYPGDFPTKRMREDHIDAARRNHHEPVMSARGGNGGVSLTLGLHQNGMGLPEGYPIIAARRFGLESQTREGYMGGFVGQTQHRQFEHIVHDFVG